MANGTSNITHTNTIYSNASNYKSDSFNIHKLFLSIVDKCNDLDYSYVRLPIEILSFVLGFPSNVALLWLLVRSEKALSPSEVLGLNLAVLNVVFCISLPLDAYISVTKRAGDLLTVLEATSILNLIGCPLLLTSMCVERYLATAHAVLYMKIGSNWEYRIVCSALIWIVTLGISGITIQQRLPRLAMYLSIILDFFLLIMLACLTGIVHVLRQKGPGEGRSGGRGGSSIKSRALKNALLILVPSAVIYGPLLAIAPYMFTLESGDEVVSHERCIILNLMNIFPSLGTCIGPVFYMSRAKQLACCQKNAEKEQTKTRDLQNPK